MKYLVIAALVAIVVGAIIQSAHGSESLLAEQKSGWMQR